MNRTGMALMLLICFIASGAIAASEPVTSSVKVQIYGKIKGDLSVDDSRTDPGTYVKWVDPEDNAFFKDGSGSATSTDFRKVKPKDDAKFNATARESRIGLNFSGPKVGSADLSGKVEIDFFGGSTNNKGEPYMRHAYGKLNWADQGTSFIFGQTWDIVSPLSPTTLNYPVLWWCGNTGYRRAQASIAQSIAMGEGKMRMQAGIFDNLGDSSFANTTGGAAEAPNFQGRISFTIPTMASKPTTIGVSGHHGVTRDNFTGSMRVDSEALYFDISMPILDWLALKGEAYSGRNMQPFLGGIGQGVNSSDHEIHSDGFWAMAALGPWDKVCVNVGAGVDNPNQNDMTTPGSIDAASVRVLNQCIFANVLFKLNQHLTMGVEVSQWKTRYMNYLMNYHDAKATRIQASAIYSFY